MRWEWPEYLMCGFVVLVVLLVIFGIVGSIWEDHYARTRPDREDHKIVALGQTATSGGGAMANGTGAMSSSTTCAALDDHGGVHHRSTPFVVGEIVICHKNCAVPE